MEAKVILYIWNWKLKSITNLQILDWKIYPKLNSLLICSPKFLEDRSLTLTSILLMLWLTYYFSLVNLLMLYYPSNATGFCHKKENFTPKRKIFQISQMVFKVATSRKSIRSQRATLKFGNNTMNYPSWSGGLRKRNLTGSWLWNYWQFTMKSDKLYFWTNYFFLEPEI